MSDSKEASVLPFEPFFPIRPIQPTPWPLPVPVFAGERSAEDDVSLGSGDVVEVVESVYLRPDVRSAVAANARTFATLIGGDDDAARELGEIIRDLNPETEERIPPLVIGALYVLGGAALGYLSRP